MAFTLNLLKECQSVMHNLIPSAFFSSPPPCPATSVRSTQHQAQTSHQNIVTLKMRSCFCHAAAVAVNRETTVAV